MNETYSIERAAYLLGVPIEKLQALVEENLVETVQEEGEDLIPKREIARLYPWLAEQDSDPADSQAAPAPMSPAPDTQDASVVEVEANRVTGRDTLVIEDEELLRIHEEMESYRRRIESMRGKMHRLGAKVSRLQAMATGEHARFWDRALALYPQLQSAGRTGLEARDGKLLLHLGVEEPEDDFRERFTRLVQEGIQKGHLPPGFMGITPPPPDEDRE